MWSQGIGNEGQTKGEYSKRRKLMNGRGTSLQLSWLLILKGWDVGCGLGYDIHTGLMDIVHNECCFARPQLRLISPNLCY